MYSICVLLACLAIACACEYVHDECPESHSTFFSCDYTRRGTLDHLFRVFGARTEEGIDVQRITASWERYVERHRWFHDILRMDISPQSIVNACDANHDGVLGYVEMLDNDCICMHTCRETALVRAFARMHEARPWITESDLLA